MSAHFPGFLEPDEEAGPEGETLEQSSPITWPGLNCLTFDFVKALMSRLVSASYRSPDLLSLFAIRKPTLNKMLLTAKDIFSREPNILDVVTPPNGRVHVFGDTHGDLHSLVEGLSLAGWPAPDNFLCFAGDCVDRGSWGVEVLLVVFVLKMWRPDCVFLLRGNHETTGCAARYGFESEVERKFDDRVFQSFIKTFQELPCAAVIRTLPRVRAETAASSSQVEPDPDDDVTKLSKKASRSRRKAAGRHKTNPHAQGEGWRSVPVPGERRILVVHGGLFRHWKASKKGSMALGSLSDLAEYRRQSSDPQDSIIEDVLWSDPQIESNDIAPNVLRGAGILYGRGATDAFFKRNNLHGLIRAHEGPDMREKRPGMNDMLGGYSLDIELVSSFVATVFSSADYPPDRPRSNKGAFATLKGAEVESLQLLPEFTQFEKRCCPDDSILFYIPPDFDSTATPRSSIS